jgi:hypothetical protein
MISRPMPASCARRPTMSGAACSGWFLMPAGRAKCMIRAFRAFREIDELRVGSHLIRAEDDRHIPDLNAVGKRRHIAMRDSLRRYSKSVTVTGSCSQPWPRGIGGAGDPAADELRGAGTLLRWVSTPRDSHFLDASAPLSLLDLAAHSCGQQSGATGTSCNGR